MGMEATLKKKFDLQLRSALEEEEQRLRNREVKGRKDLVKFVGSMLEGFKGDVLENI